MLRITVWLGWFLCVYVCGFCGLVSCDIMCPDGLVCPDAATCCMTTKGYSCSPYPRTHLTTLTEANGKALVASIIRCDSKFYCSSGTTCCQGFKGQWSCCPYPLGQCCADGRHCCEYGSTCDPSFSACRKWNSQNP